MKTPYIFFACLLSLTIAQAQQQTTLDVNNWVVHLSDNGTLFRNPVNQEPTFFHKTEKASTVFAGHLWFADELPNGQLLTAAGTFDSFGSDFESGAHRTLSVTNTRSLIKINRSEITDHQARFNDPAYEMPASIRDWPASGNVANGEFIDLAPFVDVNGNKCYDPHNGDYPAIRGDQAVYIIYNDGFQPKMATGSDPLDIEVHTMVYAWAGENDPELANAVFVNVTVANRSDRDYHSFRSGMWVDFDLGNAFDDYIGSDPENNSFFIYNGDNDDEIQGGSAPGFGVSPPAFGVRFINHEMSNFMYYNNGGGIIGDPNAATDYYNYMQTRRKDGTPVKDHNDTETNYMFGGNVLSDSEWTEMTEGNPPGDRRGVGSLAPIVLKSGERFSFDAVFGYGRSTGLNDQRLNVIRLRDNLDAAEAFFLEQNFDPSVLATNTDCEITGTEDIDGSLSTLQLYPNPATNRVQFSGARVQSATLWSLDGQQLLDHKPVNNQILDIPRWIPDGIYILQVDAGDGNTYRNKLVIR